MRRPTKGVVGIFLCHVFVLLCQRASATPVETRCILKSKYEKLWQPVNDLANRIMSIIFKAASFVFHWVPGMQASYLKPECAASANAPVVGTTPDAVIPCNHHHRPAMVANPPTGYCYVNNHVPVERSYYQYDYHD